MFFINKFCENNSRIKMMKKRLMLIILLISISLTTSEAKIKRFNAEEFFNYKSTITFYDEENKKAEILSTDNKIAAISFSKNIAETIFNDAIDSLVIENFPVSPTEKADIELKKAKTAVDLGTKWLRITSNGEITEKSFEPQFYKGNIINIKDSRVTVFYNNGYMYSIIEQNGKDNFSISPLNGRSQDKGEIHLLTSQESSVMGKDHNPFLDIHLDDDEYPDYDYEELMKHPDRLQSNELLEADIIVEATSDFYRLFNDYDKISAYIAAIMTHSSEIFERDVYVKLFVPLVIIHEDRNEDPYSTTTQIYERLYQLRDKWSNNTIKRALVCLMTDIDYQGSSGGYRVGGVSLGLETICSKSRGYCVFGMQGHYKYPTTNYTWDVSVSAHEMGHAFGSPHTHSCYFLPHMIDTCITRDKPQANSDGCVTTGNPIPRPGTLMSYCHLTNSTRTVGLYFHDRVKPIIRKASEESSCLRNAIDPALILLEPVGGSTIFPGDSLNIRWASSKVEYVAIDFSLDGGDNWDWITKYVDATKGEYIWVVPDTTSTNVMIRIIDSYNGYISDATEIGLIIDYPQFSISKPDQEVRLAQGEVFRISWEQKYLDDFKIEFTSEAVQGIDEKDLIWQTIADGISGYSYEWAVPEDIESEDCMLRISGSSKNGAVFTELSSKFAIGNPFCDILSPVNGEIICGGQDYLIMWDSDFINNVYLQYSTDGGDKWRHVKFSPIDGFEHNYLWNVPEYYSDNCVLRFSNFVNRDIIYATMEAPFKIDSCETGINDNKGKNDNLNISVIIPNPANELVNIVVDCAKTYNKNNEIVMINEEGKVIIRKKLNILRKGKNYIEIDINGIAQGNYFVMIKSGEEKCVRILQVLR
jgi:hypothetical protein